MPLFWVCARLVVRKVGVQLRDEAGSCTARCVRIVCQQGSHAGDAVVQVLLLQHIGTQLATRGYGEATACMGLDASDTG